MVFIVQYLVCVKSFLDLGDVPARPTVFLPSHAMTCPTVITRARLLAGAEELKCEMERSNLKIRVSSSIQESQKSVRHCERSEAISQNECETLRDRHATLAMTVL
jgi:hypothetical protein